MKFQSLREWKALSQADPIRWSEAVNQMCRICSESSDTSVMSVDLSKNLSIDAGPLSGVPYALKDLFDLRGWPSHCSSAMPDLVNGFAEVDSELVGRLNRLGASCAAKTQMNEFAYGLSGENPHYGDCPHPLLKGRLSGGSSSGSAHMVAAGYLPLAFGTDTGGSIRLPASWCGLYGIRWAPGYCMAGAFPLAPGFDTMGWFTRSADDMAEVLKAWFSDVPELLEFSGAALLPEDLVEPACFSALGEVICKLGLGGDPMCEELKALLPDCNRAFNVLQSREACTIHAERLQKYAVVYDPAVRQRIERGATWSERDVAFARDTSARINDWFDRYFEVHDFLVLPACPGPAIRADEATSELREKTLRLTAPASLAQKPVLTIPIVLDGVSSVGLQFIFKDVAGAVPLAILDLYKSI